MVHSDTPDLGVSILISQNIKGVMVMLIYIPYLIFSLIITVVCYITNPIVVLFANELGELPGFLANWQTWDDSLDPRFFVVNKVWSIFRYDYD